MPKRPQRSSPQRRQGTDPLPACGALYQLVFEQSPVAMWVVDGVTLKFLAVNDAAARDSGYTRAELLALSATALCPSEDLATILTETLERASQARTLMGRVRHKDGGFREAYLTWTPLVVAGKAAWLVLLTAPFGGTPVAIAAQTAPHGLPRSLPALTSDRLDAQRVRHAALAERSATEIYLRALLQSREVHLRTLQHWMKTTLQLALSLLNLQRAQLQDPRLATPFAASERRLRVLALLHDAGARALPDTHLDAAAYLHAIQAVVIRTAQVDPSRIALMADLESVALPRAQAMSCGLLFHELLANAVTHGFPEGRSGKVTVALRRAPDDMLELRVADTGVGVPAALDIHQPTRLGWQLVTLLTRQLHGEVVLEGDQGTRITVRWPR
jgi:PAS domain S-box-containing protein